MGCSFKTQSYVIAISDVFWKKKKKGSGGFTKAVNFTTNHWNHGWKNDMAIYSTNNERKLVLGEGFIRILKNKISKYRTSISKKLKNTTTNIIELLK